MMISLNPRKLNDMYSSMISMMNVSLMIMIPPSLTMIVPLLILTALSAPFTLMPLTSGLTIDLIP